MRGGKKWWSGYGDSGGSRRLGVFTRCRLIRVSRDFAKQVGVEHELVDEVADWDDGVVVL